MENLTKSTKREINNVIEILKSFTNYNSLTDKEKQMIEYQLNLIARSAIDDIRQSIANLIYNTENELKQNR